MTPHPPFDAVLFDLDGTLVATDRFWIPAAKAGARRAFAELGIEREPPSPAEWMGMVGLPLEDAFALVFADLDPHHRARLMELCIEEEHARLKAGGAALLPGAREVLGELAAGGARLAIASNCGRDYLVHMLGALDLGELVHDARCLDSRGVRDKADMIQDLLESFGTRSAVMVGDRPSDRDAAWANGIPHVHFESGVAASGEGVDAQGEIDVLAELPELLAGRWRWIDGILEELGLGRDEPAAGPRTVGVTGPPCAGKGLMARDLARRLGGQGRAVRVISLESFELPGTAADPERSHALDLLTEGLLAPCGRGEGVRLNSANGREGGDSIEIPAGTTLILEGAGLLAPRLRARLDRVVALEASHQECLRRAAGRDGRLAGPGALERFQGAFLAYRRGREGALDPGRADLRVDAENPLGPLGT